MEYFFNFEKIAYIQGERPDGCILCLIRDKSEQVENLTILENSLFYASLNLYPYNPGHLLVFPKRHLKDIRELTNDEVQSQHEMISLLLEVLDETQAPTGYNLGFNMGLDAGASIEHLHFHLIPRYPKELGVADLVAGKRVLVESPVDTAKRIKTKPNTKLLRHPRSNFTT